MLIVIRHFLLFLAVPAFLWSGIVGPLESYTANAQGSEKSIQHIQVFYLDLIVNEIVPYMALGIALVTLSCALNVPRERSQSRGQAQP